MDGVVKYLQNHSNRIVVGLLLLGNLLLVILVVTLGSSNGHTNEAWHSERMLRDIEGHAETTEQDVVLNITGAADGGGADNNGGAVFTRWGRKVCPDDDQLVYAGVAGGSHFSHKGGGSNYICLPLDPIYGKTLAGVQNRAIIYGAEYQTNFGILSDASTTVGGLKDKNVPCSVCHTHRTVMMIPGRNECYGDWRMEYTGYLMASHHSHEGRSEFVCMDGEPEADEAGFENENGALFYHVEGFCGSLPCPPYDNGKELTCVVCTK